MYIYIDYAPSQIFVLIYHNAGYTVQVCDEMAVSCGY